MDFLIPVLILVLLVTIALAIFFYRRAAALGEQLSSLKFSKSSQSVRYGKMTEQWIPFAEKFPHPSEQFRFIGSPIDGIVFADDEIVFCEFKSGTSKLNDRQKLIKELVKGKKVEWMEFTIS